MKMLAIYTIVTTFCLLGGNSSYANGQCVNLKNSPPVGALAATLKISSRKTIYPGTDVNKWNIVVRDSTNFPKCIAVITSQKVFILKLDQALNNSSLFSFFRSAETDGALYAKLEEQSVHHGLLLDIAKFKDFKETWIDFGAFRDVSFFLTNFAMHEAFHFYRQNNGALNGSDHRMLWIGPNTVRRHIRKECYLYGKRIEQLVKKEVNLLVESLVSKKTEIARELAIEFVNTRSERYNVLAAIKKQIKSCPASEADFELIEGSASYFGFKSMILSGQASLKQLVEYVNRSVTHSLAGGAFRNEIFYETGMLQLLFVRKIDEER